MEAREFLNLVRDNQRIIRVAHYTDDACDGRGNALVLDSNSRIAVMLENCGDPDETLIKAGAIINYVLHPEAEPKIVGTPAYVSPVILGGRRVH
jgi:hypothetical protein